MRPALLSPFAVLLMAAAAPQKPVVIPGLGESVEVSIINVDVVVTDAKGNHVRGLTRDDFEIRENGIPQPISNFAEYGDGFANAHASVEGNAALPNEKRTLVLFFEPFRIASPKVNSFFDALEEMVRRTIRPGDSVSVIEYDHNPRVVVAPTDDVQRVAAILEEFRKTCTGPYHDPTIPAVLSAQAVSGFDTVVEARGTPRGGSGAARAVGASWADDTKMYAMGEHLAMKRRIAAINSAIDSMAAGTGRKLLILSPHRLGRYSGAEFYYAVGFDRVPPDAAAEFDNSPELEGIAANANSAGVTIYPFYAPGVDETSADPAAPDIAAEIMANEMIGLEDLARSTGGLTSWGPKNVAMLLPQVAEDASQYYSLAYNVKTRREDAVRKVTVRTKNATLKVRSRTEYVEKSDDTRMRERVIAAAHQATQEPDFHVSAELGRMRRNGRRWVIPVEIAIPGSGLTPVPSESKYVGAFSVYIASATNEGDVGKVTHQTQRFEFPAADVARVKASHFTYEIELVVDDAARHVAVGVLDEVSKSFGVAHVPIKW